MEVFVKLGQIRTPEDVYDWMDENIQYGWLDTENGQHIGEMKNFRKSYRTMSLEEILEYRFGTCIEQVALMKFLLDKIRVVSNSQKSCINCCIKLI